MKINKEFVERIKKAKKRAVFIRGEYKDDQFAALDITNQILVECLNKNLTLIHIAMRKDSDRTLFTYYAE